MSNLVQSGKTAKELIPAGIDLTPRNHFTVEKLLFSPIPGGNSGLTPESPSCRKAPVFTNSGGKFRLGPGIAIILKLPSLRFAPPSSAHRNCSLHSDSPPSATTPPASTISVHDFSAAQDSPEISVPFAVPPPYLLLCFFLLIKLRSQFSFTTVILLYSFLHLRFSTTSFLLLRPSQPPSDPSSTKLRESPPPLLLL